MNLNRIIASEPGLSLAILIIKQDTFKILHVCSWGAHFFGEFEQHQNQSCCSNEMHTSQKEDAINHKSKD